MTVTNLPPSATVSLKKPQAKCLVRETIQSLGRAPGEVVSIVQLARLATLFAGGQLYRRPFQSVHPFEFRRA